MAKKAYQVEYRAAGGAISHHKRLLLDGKKPQAEAEAVLHAFSTDIEVLKVEAAG